MLTSIELYGFKSFADRVKIELDGNICALIGPNGSGKSNVVDAIKWALGEQSVKRLRGDEMTDVIFNGSATRQPLGSAEVTISFDNKKRILPIEADEVHFTRRVYRSGESEYLINGQAARLRDFRDLIGGVGLGAQGYAVIEQGRVEALLQSTSEQRRAVLEDAAGVSRFNAKKQEATRRLERVEQNLLRLSDIVNEIEAQLRKTKAQAGKAEIYRKCSTRLQKLRTEVSLYEWRVKSEAMRLASLETNDFESFETDVSAKIQTLETESARLSTEIADADCGLRAVEAELSTAREKIAAEEYESHLVVVDRMNNGKQTNMSVTIDVMAVRDPESIDKCMDLQQDVYGALVNMTAFTIDSVNVRIRDIVRDREEMLSRKLH